MARSIGKWKLPQPTDIKENNEWTQIPRIARTIPFGYKQNESDPDILDPIKKELDLLDEATDTKDNLSAEGLQRPDIADRAQVESNAAIQLRTRDRERKLISKIDSALRRIDLGTYGYCEETSEPIGIRRLDARPIATLSVEAQERHERMEKIHIDD